MSKNTINVKQVKTKNKLTNAHDEGQFGWILHPEHFEKYLLLVYGNIWRFCRGLWARGECEDNPGTRYTRDTLESACAMPCIRNNVWQTVVTRLFVFAYSVTNDEQKSIFIVLLKVKHRHWAQVVKIHTSEQKSIKYKTRDWDSYGNTWSLL